MSNLPLRLLCQIEGKLQVINPHDYGVREFDIITYTWGDTVDPYRCEIPGVEWNVKIAPRKLEDIRRLMVFANIQFLWVDCVCLNQDDEQEMAVEVLKMYEYYKSARQCYILMEMNVVWNPRAIIDHLKFIDHILFHMGGAALATEANLSRNLTEHLSLWGNTEWAFRLDPSIVRSAGIDMGVLNCYSTCINQVRSLFDNPYFSRVWTFQEMLLGKNITMYGINGQHIACIGQLDTWMDLATETKDKAYKLHAWIELPRVLKTTSVNAILNVIDEDGTDLDILQTQVKGISSARMDIINGGPRWWFENHKGISNIFSAISLRPRSCYMRRDLFRGLLGIFSGLFTPEETARDLMGEDIEKLSFAFFKQLSNKTGNAWTKLAISSGERGEMDWIPVVANHNKALTTDIFAGVVHLGRLKPKGFAKGVATTGILGSPKGYMKITLHQDTRGWQFTFKGCNAGKKVSTGVFGSEPIPLNSDIHNVAGDETGRILVQCATILGSLMDPGYDIATYRRRLLGKLQPHWTISDPNAKPTGWIDRCVSGTGWGNLDPDLFRVHNRSMNYRLRAMTGCSSRLQNDTTAGISCEVRVNCGCTITGPFSLIFEAITAVENSSLGGTSATLDKEGRITLSDGLGLVQVGDIGKSFNLVATSGDVDYHRSYSSLCRSTKNHKPVTSKYAVPRGRVLVRDDFTHGLYDAMRDYGYVDFTNRAAGEFETGEDVRGSGNLLICRNNPLRQYKIIGVCIDNWIENKGGQKNVTIR